MGLLEITGLPNNLEYSINENNYILGDKICDDIQTSKCKLGATKTIYITIKYIENGFDSLNTQYSIDLSFDFEKYFTISYVGFLSTNNLLAGILENETKSITFTNTNGITVDVSVVGATAIYSSPNLSLTNPTNNVVVENKHSISYVLNEGTQVQNQVTSIYASETVTLFDPTKEGENFDGWFDNPEFEGTKITELSNIQNDITLYAKWNQYDYYVDEVTFDGTTASVINTHLRLYSAENVNKNFRIAFTIEEYNSKYDDPNNINNNTPPTIVSSMLETGAPYPGFVCRLASNRMIFAAKCPGQTDGNKPDTASTPKLVSITRRNGVIYYSVAGSTPAASLTEIFRSNLTFGASSKYNSTTGVTSPMRFFKGVVSDISVEINNSE